MPTQTSITKSSNSERPSNVKAIAVMSIISGAINIVGAFGVTVAIVLGTLFLGIICAPITILPAILGVFEILYGVKLLSNPPQPVKPSQAIAIFEIVTFLYLNVISGVIGILALTMYNDPEVKAYFERINAA
jgi:4-hydroxybenzoate polyprenyltransferase